MQSKNQISLTRKTLYGIMLLGLFFFTFGAGNLPSVQAQEEADNPPTPGAKGISPASNTDTPALEGTSNTLTSGPMQTLKVMPTTTVQEAIAETQRITSLFETNSITHT